MGFWKDVAIDIQNGMSEEKATKLNASLRYGTPEEKQEAKIEYSIYWASKKIDSMP